MTTNELSRPLGTRPAAAKRRLPSVPLAKPLAALGLAALAFLGGWILLVDDPLGGEPQAVASIVRRTTPVAAAPEKDQGALPTVSTPQQGQPGPAPAADASQSADVVIRPVGPGDSDLPDGVGNGGPMVIRVPGSPGSDSNGVVVRDPDPRLIEQVSGLDLPRIGADGTRPMTAYARPAGGGMLDPRPKVAILIGGLGVSENTTTEAIAKLPANISLAFAPYAGDLERWASRARSDGHEYMLQLPMEPFDYPNNDPGPQTLLTSEPDAVNLERLRWILGRMRGYVGVANFMGARFTSSEGSLSPVMTEIGRRGLMFIDDGSSPRSLAETLATKAGATATQARVVIDAQAAPAEIDAALARLEDLARTDGMAIGIGTALPVTIDRVAEWAKRLNGRGFVLVPVSAIVNRPQTKLTDRHGMADTKDLPYRPCVGIMLLNADNKVFIGRRSDAPDDPEGPGQWWQMPQGGIDEGEDPWPAALRELYEETNVRSVEKLAETDGWLAYDFPPGKVGQRWKNVFRGQKQKWYAVRLTGGDSEIDVLRPAGGAHKAEFSVWRWEDMDRVPDLIIPFKREVYLQVIERFRHLAG